MSRYIFAGNKPGLNITVGWDRPLKTYFVQVWDGGEPEEGNLRLWAGTTEGEMTSVESIINLLSPYAQIPQDVLAQLRGDTSVEADQVTERTLSAAPLVPGDGSSEEDAGCENFKEVLTRYHGEVYLVVFGPPCFVEQRNGALMGTGMPSIDLADPKTGVPVLGLTFDIPEAPLRPGQVLVGGKEEGLHALTEAGVVRFTGAYYRSKRFWATFAICDLLVGPCRRRTPTTPG